MGREYRILSRLHAVYPPAPRPSPTARTTAMLGAPFYVMERMRGVILRRDPPAGADCRRRRRARSARRSSTPWRAARARLPRGGPRRPRQARGLRRAAGDAAGPSATATRGPTTSPIWSVSRRGSPPAHARRSRAPRSSTTTTSTTTWCSTPDDLTRIIGVLDWEMSTIGDPLMDLGTALGYWVDADDPTRAAGGALRRHHRARAA